MEQTKKHLKMSSIIVLIFAGVSLLNIVSALLFGDFNSVDIPNGAPLNIVEITKIILLVVSLLCLLPRVYVGVKGLRVVKNPDSSKAHIVWATIIFVITIIGMISPVLKIVQQTDVSDNVSSLLDGLLNAVIYFEYIKYAKQLTVN